MIFFFFFPLPRPPQDPRGSQDPQAGGAGAGSRRQRHRPGAHRGQTVQPRGKTPRRRRQMDPHMARLIDEERNIQIFSDTSESAVVSQAVFAA